MKEDKSHVSKGAVLHAGTNARGLAYLFLFPDCWWSFFLVAGEPSEKDLPAGGAAPQWDAVEGWVGAEMQVHTGIKIYHLCAYVVLHIDKLLDIREK